MNISKSTWTVLSTGLSLYASYPTRGAVSHPRLLFQIPEFVRGAVVGLWDDPEEPVADVYTFTANDTDPPQFVVIKRSIGRAVIQRELCYPDNIDHIVEACRQQARTFGGYTLWHWMKNEAAGDEKVTYAISIPFGLVFVTVGAFIVLNLSLGGVPSDEEMIAAAMSKALLAMGTFFALYPPFMTWFERFKLRRALRLSAPAI
jgi:hypothetical protein